MGKQEIIYTYTLSETGNDAAYDEALAVVTLQGIINREAPRLYILSDKNNRPKEWLDILCHEGEWLNNRIISPLSDLDALVKLAGNSLKGGIIWDPNVPATVNVATTISGVEDAIVLSPELADKYLHSWNMNILHDLRGLFNGSLTGSAKNDAYRWAVQEYLSKGCCSSHFLFLYEDSFFTRDTGAVHYVITRDWAVRNRAFVFDLSPWGDEKPADDLFQSMGTDLETYQYILEEINKQSAGKHMTEMAGFFAFSKYSNVPEHKSSHDPVPTEWETVRLISPYNCYQNTVAHNCFNQSFHSRMPFTPLKQHHPCKKSVLENKTYVCFHMSDYDSATPLYEFMLPLWKDKNRGRIPLAWGINPNLIETYPDLITFFYRTATQNDYFVSDASAAGYFNPDLIQEKYLPLFIKHNRYFFEKTDMSIAPMVLDWDEPTPAVKDAFASFAPNGYATIIYDYHTDVGKTIKPHIWKEMPVIEMKSRCDAQESIEKSVEKLFQTMSENTPDAPQFYYERIIWTNPSYIIEIMDMAHKKNPEREIELVDPYTFFELYKEYLFKNT